VRARRTSSHGRLRALRLAASAAALMLHTADAGPVSIPPRVPIASPDRANVPLAEPPDHTPLTGTRIVPLPAAPAADLYAAPTTMDHIGRVIAPVMINGQGPFRFVVDTGANYSVVTRDLARRLALAPNSGDGVRLNGVTGAQQVPTVSIDKLEVGDLTRRNLNLPVLESVMSAADGILGMDEFEDMRLVVDFVRNRINISRSRGQRATGSFLSSPVHLRFGHLMVATVEIGGVVTRAVIDTGAQRTLGNLALRDALVRHHHGGGRSERTDVFGVTDSVQEGEYADTPPITVGNAQLSTVVVTYGDIYVFKLWSLDKTPSLLLGMDVLGVLDTLIVDYKLKEIQMKPRI
jgi:predicted aspartyl protease